MNVSDQAKEECWQNFIERLSLEIDHVEVEAWVTDLELIDFDQTKIVLGGLNQFFCNWVKDRYTNTLKNLLIQSFHILSLDQSFQLILQVSNKNTINSSKSNSPKKDFSESPPHSLDPRFTFDNFVNGNNSDIAYAAARSVADDLKNTHYNPLFLCGDVGLGKTHLMQAIGLEILEKKPITRILYTTSEQFTNEVIDGIRFGKINKIREKYRSLDLLLIDDIQFLENKSSTQEEFFHTFNDLIGQNKQVIITSDRYPKEIKQLEERLVNRFSSGMIARIEPPEFETRVAIILNEVRKMKIPIRNEVINTIAASVKSNVRDIKGILIRIEAEWSLLGQEIDSNVAKRVLKEVLSIETNIKSIEDIMKSVCQRLDVKVSDIKSEKRDREISQARQIAMFVSREITDLSFPVIGKHFGGKNHTSVLQACKKTKLMMEKDPELSQIVKGLIRELSI